MNTETFQRHENARSSSNPLLSFFTLFFLYDPLTTSLHGFKKNDPWSD